MKTILFQGDSITDAYRVEVQRARGDDQYAGSGYPTMAGGYMCAEYPGEYRFFNRGISGNRIVDVYSRIKSDIINLKPDYISILIGVNDVWHELSYQNGVDPPKFEKLYTMMIEEIKAALPDVKIMIMEPFVLHGAATQDSEKEPHRWDGFRLGVPERAAAARRVAEKFNLPYVPLQCRFDEGCKKAEASYWLYDGVHPTAAGHALIAKAWLEAFQANFIE